MDRQDVYVELNKIWLERNIAPDEIYLSDYARDNGCNLSRARDFIKDLERDGIVKIRMVSYPRRGMVFRFIGKNQTEPPTGGKRERGKATF